VDRRIEHLADRFGLDDLQRARMRETAGAAFGSLLNGRERARELRGEIRDRLSKSEIDRDAVLALVLELRAVQAEHDSLIAEIMLREAEVLTPEQRARYFDSLPWSRGEPRGRPGFREGRSPGR
jgi:Spy/CpxP family protein refolding chaperone